MKRCKNRECEGYSRFVDDECTGCAFCRGELESVTEHSNVSMGNANAVSGGIHSTEDHSKKESENEIHIGSHNTTKTGSDNEIHTGSHNTTNNTTIYEAEKSASEKLIENERAYRLKCKELIKDGLISKEGKSQLREMQVCLNLPDELASPIREEIRLHSRRRKKQLTMTGMYEIRQTKSIIEQNTAPALQLQLEKLETWMQEYDDDTLKLMYYQMSSMLDPVRYTNRYEDSVKDEYWEAYWAYIAYLLQNREKQANEALASLGRWHTDYPEQNDTILLLVGRLMQDEPIEDIHQVKKQLTAHFTADLQLLLDAIDELLQMDWVKESILIRPTHSFYITTLFGQFVETQKAAGVEHLKVKREEERKKREEEERIRLAELERQNQIREKKTSVLQKFQEISSIEIACQEVGVEFHTFNIWLEEDSTFASSYNDLVHRMEVRKYEEAERKRKEQELQEEIKQKKSQFRILFEQNKCDLLKTCSEVGISSTDYQEWRRLYPVFNDEINYIIRENQKVIDQQYRQKRAKIIKKVSLIIGALAILLVLVLGAKTIIDNINETKAAEEARIEAKREQEEIQKEKIVNQHQSLIDDFNQKLATVKSASSTPDVETFDAALISLEKSLAEIRRFEDSNPSISDLKYQNLRQGTIEMCIELDSLFLHIGVEHSDLDDIPKWDDMQLCVKSLKDRL